MRLLLHHAEDEIRIDAVTQSVLLNQSIESPAARRPTSLVLPLLRAVRVCDLRSSLACDPFIARLPEDDRHAGAFVPGAFARLANPVPPTARARDRTDRDRYAVRRV